VSASAFYPSHPEQNPQNHPHFIPLKTRRSAHPQIRILPEATFLVSGRYLDSKSLGSDITWRYLDCQNLDSQNQVRVRVSVTFRVNFRARVSYD